jgi:hypothetical protein
MKKLYLSLAIFLGATFLNSVSAQNNHERCGYNHVVDYYESINPDFKLKSEAIYQQTLENANGSRGTRSEAEYTIPVVVHVVYSSAEHNLPDSVIFDQIRVLNEDFRRLNADTVNLRDTFLTVAGSPNVGFRLASYDPDGNVTTGITRTSTTELFGEGGGWAGPEISEIEDVKITANGGIDPWDQTKYMNIWVCDMSGGGEPSLFGYATPPANLSNWPAGSTDGMSDGVVIQYHCMGSNNPNPLVVQGSSIAVVGRTVTHEVGHYLGLRHTAEQAWFGGPCDDDDGLDDTPKCEQSSFDCNTTRNSCTDNIVDVFGNTVGDLPDMVENYMDYSDELCQNSFTFGQAGIIIDVMENYRNGLLDNGKLSSIGVINMDELLVTVYPNPSMGVFDVNFVNGEVTQIGVYNELGQLIVSETVNGITQSQIDLTEQPKGIYFLKIEGKNSSKVEKLILK